jgi:hypothetical protein
MDIRDTSADLLLRNTVATAAELLTLSSICPACGYPSLDMELCAYCRPLIQSPVGGSTEGLITPAT